MEGLHIAYWTICPVSLMRGMTLLLKGGQLLISLHLHLDLQLMHQKALLRSNYVSMFASNTRYGKSALVAVTQNACGTKHMYAIMMPA